MSSGETSHSSVHTVTPLQVVLTDQDEIVPLLEHNIKLNQDVLACENVSALPLTWGNIEEVSVAVWQCPTSNIVLFCSDQTSSQIPRPQGQGSQFNRLSSRVGLRLLQGEHRSRSDGTDTFFLGIN